VKNIIASGYINTTALTSSDYIRSVNFIASGFIQVRPTNGFGQVISGIGIRSSGRSQQFVLSNNDSVSETYYGSDSDGTGTTDKNNKWCFSSRSSTENKFMFYRAPFYTKSGFDNVMDFHNVDEKNCLINLNKPTNISGEAKISNILNVTQKITTGSIQINGNNLPVMTHYVAQLNWDWIVARPTLQMQLIGNTVTMTIESIPRTPTVGMGRSSISTPYENRFPEEYRPDNWLYFPIFITQGDAKTSTLVVASVSPDGIISVHSSLNPTAVSPYFLYDTLSWEGFSNSWVKGIVNV